MQIKKLLKYLPITIMSTGLILTTFSAPMSTNNQMVMNNDLQADNVQTVASVADIQYITSGQSNSTFAIVKDLSKGDRLYGWGYNGAGNLGIGVSSGDNVTTPTLCKGIPENVTINAVYAGLNFTAVVINSTELYMVGADDNGYQGNGVGNTPTNEFTKNTTISGKGNITQVSAGGYHILVAIDNKTIYAWGINNYNQCSDSTETKVEIPTLVSGIEGTLVKGIYATDGNSYVWIDNKIYAWGNSWALGKTEASTQTTPLLVTLPAGTVTAFNAGSVGTYISHCHFVIDNTELYAFGSNSNGVLGNGTTTYAPTPTLIDSYPEGISNLYVGDSISAIKVSNDLLITGYNNYGQLGLGTADNISTVYQKITGYTPTSSTTYGLSKERGMAVTNGVTHFWGSNANGQFGNGVTSEKNLKPVLSDPFGTPSIITSKDNSALTANDALKDFYPNAVLSETNLKKYIDVDSFPTGTRFSITSGVTPQADNKNKKITMSLTASKSFLQPDGAKSVTSIDIPITITGFEWAPTTNIVARPADEFPANLPVVDKWQASVTVGGAINRAKLQEYLVLTDVPSTASFQITQTTPDFKTGVLTVKLQTTKVMSGGIVQDTASEIFTVTLNLAPRITKLTAITTGYPNNLTPAVLKQQLFNADDLVIDQTTLQQYIAISAPVENAKYYLFKNSWVANAIEGTVTFSVYADQYYDANGDLQTDSSTTPVTKVSTTLQLQREPSTIAIKAVMPDVRVDHFEEYVKTVDDTVSRDKLSEFLVFTNIPSDAVFSMSTPIFSQYDANYTRNRVTFDLTIDKFNQGRPVASSSHTETITLTLGVQHKPTAIVKQYDGNPNLRVDKAVEQLTGLENDALINFLRPWISFQSLPENSTITVESIYGITHTGKLSFIIVPTTIYDEDSNIATPTTEVYKFELQFGIKYAPTEITQNLANTDRVDNFANKISTLKTRALYDYLNDVHLIMTSVLPEYFSAEVISQNNATGEITFKVTVTKYYAANSELISKPKEWIFSANLIPVYPTTVITGLSASIYPHDLTVAQFKAQLIADGAVNVDNVYNLKASNLPFLRKFMQIENIPNLATYSLQLQTNSAETPKNQISFNIMISNYYDAYGDHIPTAKTFETTTLILRASSVSTPEKTEISGNFNAEPIETPEEFINSVKNADGGYDLAKLGQYVNGLNSLPYDCKVLDIVAKDELNPDGSASFTLKVSTYYNGLDKNPQVNGEYLYQFTVRTIEMLPTEPEDSGIQFPWWWIIVGVGGAAVVGLSVWLIIRKLKLNKTKTSKAPEKIETPEAVIQTTDAESKIE